MFEVYLNNKVILCDFFETAKSIAKASGLWYYITNGSELIWSQDDDIMEELLNG